MEEFEGTTSRGFRAFALIVLFTANFLNYLDRFILSALLPEIKAELNFEDTQAGLLWTSFTVGYMLAAPFVGALSDRFSRPRLFAVCIILWSVATILTGQARTFNELMVVRFFIGIGEAGCLAIGPSLVADIFPPHQRGRALSIFFLGLPLGSAAGYIFGGQFGTLWPLERSFLVAGAPGIVLAMVMLWLRDIPRGTFETETRIGIRIQGLRPYAGLFRIRTLVLVIFAQAFAAFSIIPIVHFGVDYFQNIRGWDKTPVTWMVAGALVAGMIGNITSGFVGDRLRRTRPGAYSELAARGFLYGLPFLWLAFAAPTVVLVGTCLSLCMFFYTACMPAVNTQIAMVTSPSQRSMAYAMTVFIMHLLGDTVSPPLFGHISDSHSQGLAFAVIPILMVPAGVLSWMAARSAPSDQDTMREATQRLPLVQG